MSDTLSLFQASELSPARLSVPRRGHVLSTVTEAFGGPIRDAVKILSLGLETASASLPPGLQQTPIVGANFVVRRSAAEMLAWHMCSRWIVGIALGRLCLTDTVFDAAYWFNNDGALSVAEAATLLTPQQAKAALEQLRSIADPGAFAELLPYILDPHGPGSRLSVMRDPGTEVTRALRRIGGVFYTPADVAEHMAALALTNIFILLPHGLSEQPQMARLIILIMIAIIVVVYLLQVRITHHGVAGLHRSQQLQPSNDFQHPAAVDPLAWERINKLLHVKRQSISGSNYLSA